MRELEQRQRRKRRLYSWPVLVLFLFVTFMFVRGTYGVFKKKFESQHDLQALEAQKQSLDAEQSELSNNIASLQTESGIEKEVKEKYNVAKPGEHVVILVDPEPTSTPEAATSTPWYRRFWNAIMGIL